MTTYDVFLSHNDADRAAVAAVAAKLVEAGLRPFLDRWHLVPGESFMPALEKALEDSRAVAVFFGPAGVSAWEDEEKQLALALVTEARRRGRRVIPVILPGGRHEDVAGFIRLRTWVDLAEEDGILRLVAGIEGRAPGPPTKRVGSRRPSGVARDQVAGKTDGEPPGARRGGDPGTPKQRHADRVSHEDGRPPIARQTSAKPATYRISILHISDLHARSLEVEELPEEVRHQRRGQVRREAASRARVLGEAWGGNVRALFPGGQRPDLVCFTGDVADWGLRSEYRIASRWMLELVQILGIHRSRIFVVPGNHDVQRHVSPDEWSTLRELARAEPEAVSKWLAGDEPPRAVDGAIADAVMKRSASFWEWVTRDLRRPELHPARNPHGRLGYHQVPSSGHLPFPVHVIGLDSAWMAGADDDQGKLWLTPHQCDMLLHDEHGRPWEGFRLALVHHPLGELAQPDLGPSQRALARAADLLLHGHQHEPTGNSLVDMDGDSLRVLAAGSLYEGTKGRQWRNGCQRIDVLLDERGRPQSAEIHFRTWSSRGHWYSDSSLYRGLQNGRMKWGAWVREAAVDGPTVAQTEPPTERLVGAGEEQRTATPEGLVTAASRPKAEAAKSVVDTNFEASSSAVSRMSETTSPAAPELVLPPSLDHHDLVDQLAESFNEDQATVVLSRIRFPTPNRPRFDSGQTFWHQVVELLRNGVIAGDGVQSLIDVAAKMRPGHHFFACHATEQVPVAPDEPPPMPPSATPHPLDPASVSKVGECLGKHRKLVEHMSVCNADWAAAAESGNESLARTLLGTSDPVALVDGFRDAIVRLPRRAGSREVVDAELDLLDLLLPTVAGPVLAASREGKVKTTFALTVEACRAGIDGRPMEIRERHADDPTPRALVDTDPRRRPKTGAHVSFGVVDVAAQVEEQVDDLTSDEFVEARLLHSVMDVLRAADFGASKEVEGLPLAKKAAVAKSVIRKVRGRHGHTMTLYAIVPQRTTGAPPDPFVRRLADTLDGLCIIEPPTDLDDLDVELFTALRGLYTAYRKLLEDLSR